jgi:hypothetical protein
LLKGSYDCHDYALGSFGFHVEHDYTEDGDFNKADQENSMMLGQTME